METAICVFDPTGEIPQGELVEDSRRLHVQRTAGAVFMPADPDLVQRGSVFGYYRRDWGSGVPWNRMAGAGGCPMLLFAVANREHLYWAAEVQSIDPDQDVEASLRLMADSTQLGTAYGGFSAVSLPAKIGPKPIADKTAIIVKAQTKLALTKEGYLPICLYGIARNMRVMWTAVTQSRQSVSTW